MKQAFSDDLTTSIFQGPGWRKWLRLALAWAESGRCWFAAFDVKSEKFAICNLDADVWGGSFVNLDVKSGLQVYSYAEFFDS